MAARKDDISGMALLPPGRETPEVVRTLYRGICALQEKLAECSEASWLQRCAERVLPARICAKLFRRRHQKIAQMKQDIEKFSAQYRSYMESARKRREKIVEQGNAFGRSLLQELELDLSDNDIPDALHELLQAVCVVAGDLLMRMKLASSPAQVARAIPALMQEAEHYGKGEGRLSFIEDRIREVLLSEDAAEELARRPVSRESLGITQKPAKKTTSHIDDMPRIADIPVPGSQSVH
ncbi:MAG: hypothetical protein IT567_03760 [Alphaproteobacteria bacterium]|nr:hypothetical protein [Alphaproteobacteria bacterium]